MPGDLCLIDWNSLFFLFVSVIFSSNIKYFFGLIKLSVDKGLYSAKLSNLMYKRDHFKGSLVKLNLRTPVSFQVQSMKSTFNLSLVAIFVWLAIACYFEFADADCCYMCVIYPSIWSHSLPIIQPNYCADCTPGTPYCGYGSCNFIGCNCGGGCRKEDTSLWCYQKKDYSPSSSNETISLLQLYDTDSNSALSQEEFSALFEGNFDGDALQEFQTLDVNSDGYVSFSEIDPDF